MDQSNQRTNISRRGFLASLASATFIAAFPSIANAQTMASANVSNDTSKGEQAKALWEEAVRKAKQEGAEVHENLIPGPQALTRALKTGVATMSCVIKLAPTQVDAVATYNTSGNNITTVQNAWILRLFKMPGFKRIPDQYRTLPIATPSSIRGRRCALATLVRSSLLRKLRLPVTSTQSFTVMEAAG